MKQTIEDQAQRFLRMRSMMDVLLSSGTNKANMDDVMLAFTKQLCFRMQP
jgi:hypothetical protein